MFVLYIDLKVDMKVLIKVESNSVGYTYETS